MANPRWKIWPGLLGLLAAATLQTGCGSASTTREADPAMVTPASVPLYVSVALEPAGGAQGAASVDVRQLTHLEDPFGGLTEALLRTHGFRPSFKGEVEPWAGERAAIFLLTAPTASPPASTRDLSSLGASTRDLSSLGASMRNLSSLGASAFASGRQQGAIVLDVSDESRARAFLDRLARGQGARAASYRGVRFQASPSGQAMALVDGFAIIGSESGVKSAIDTAHGAAPLSHVTGYSKPPSNAVADAYLVPPRLSRTPGRSPGAFGGLVGDVRSAALLVTAGTGSLSLEGRLQTATGATPVLGEAGARMVRTLPGDSWLALGLADGGMSLPRVLGLARSASGALASRLSTLGLGGVQRLIGRLGSSARLRRSFTRWAGPAGLFASGASLLELQAALVIDSMEPVASRAAVGELASVAREAGAIVDSASVPGTEAAESMRIPGFPAVVYVADGQGKLIVGLGQASVLGALHPSSTLADSPAYAASASALGEGVEPGLIVEFPTLLSLLEAIGATQSAPVAEAVPYLKSLGRLTAGSTVHGTSTTVRAQIELASTPSG